MDGLKGADWDYITNKKESDYWEEQKKKSELLKKLPSDMNYASLGSIDIFLKDNWPKITCADISAMYWKFWWDLKKMKANSRNFVGYSEFLILRSLLHQLGGDDRSQPYCKSRKKDLGFFVAGKNRDLRVLTERLPAFPAFEHQKGNPDIVLYKENPARLSGMIQVKAAPTSKSSVDKDENFFDELYNDPCCRDVCRDMKGLIVIFGKFRERQKNRWTTCSLWKNDKLLSQVFRESLDLDRL